MQNIISVWKSLGARNQIISGLASVAVFLAVLFMTRVASTPTYALLYSGLESSASGEVIASLEAQSAAYEIRGDSIFVDSAKRDQLRMTLASAGLPKPTVQGYELLDTLTGFGTTSQMFDAAYWRAKEGELARTIVATPAIRTARVHISNGTSRPFQRNQATTASVTVNTGVAGLTTQQIKALQYLVASAVAQMSPEDVAIIDDQRGLVSGAGLASDPTTRTSETENIKRNIERLLEARVGFGNAVVELNVQRTTDIETILERRVDPNSRVAISTETEERSTSSTDQNGGSVTVASNLPDGDAAADSGTSNSQNSESRERVNFEMSETQREVTRGPGQVQRITVAVLVDGVNGLDSDGNTTIEPRSEEELADLRELVASAIGFDENRGDKITIRSLAFEPLPVEGTVAGSSKNLFDSLNLMSLIQIAVAASVAIVLGLFVVRPVLMSGRAYRPALIDDSGPLLDGEIDTSLGLSATEIGEMKNVDGAVQVADPSMPNDPVVRLRALIEERQEETVDILRDWIAAPSKNEKTT
ncbi:flagellar basal-body MS-ring/collar protein FliF [Thalassobium sp. R2A62]|uniref:flagellar basal-body MS-ring/collar protein FliF n=1 Tax=Thalassobium sp. R2A62 TaxID=633131 RepID=UPI0001B1D4AF|nr:flagellar basal-body MS-ring/collar protein FliF [Thalassobium sp. R2A62]EET49109.1 flagellar M-ring protein FliF [Thalassobium sp. R2A62]MDG1339527.1 flagellar basal-body MS-ring/collar protein FliF [Paracoccaceae bacterium]MDG1801231.1 flagellar basal-body MS-ring/collar protein FliF [Paracoccaceae bacterium]MDG2453920.1 flagellar basal-body MS-ring/collar protein FliF [Paracoccaceae bacterium]